MSGTTVVAVKAAVRDALAALSGTGGPLSGVQVSYANPGSSARRETVYLGDVEDGEHEVAAFRSGTVPRREVYLLPVLVEVTGKPSVEANETRAVAIGTVVEETVCADPTLGGVANVASVVPAGFALQTDDTDAGLHLSRLTVLLRVTARLR